MNLGPRILSSLGRNLDGYLFQEFSIARGASIWQMWRSREGYITDGITTPVLTALPHYFDTVSAASDQ